MNALPSEPVFCFTDATSNPVCAGGDCVWPKTTLAQTATSTSFIPLSQTASRCIVLSGQPPHRAKIVDVRKFDTIGGRKFPNLGGVTLTRRPGSVCIRSSLTPKGLAFAFYGDS